MITLIDYGSPSREGMISREISLGFISVDRVELAAIQLCLEVEGQFLRNMEENEWKHGNTQDLMTG